MPETLHFALLENGLDFLRSAFERLSFATSSDMVAPDSETTEKEHLKYAVLHLAAGVELILKDRLRQKDWKLIVKKPHKVTDAMYEAGDFQSIDLTECVRALRVECNIVLTSDDNDALKQLKYIRNKLEHFTVIVSRKTVVDTASQVGGFILRFLATLDDEMIEAHAELLSDVQNLVHLCPTVSDDVDEIHQFLQTDRIM
jgi:hypothetical protein